MTIDDKDAVKLARFWRWNNKQAERGEQGVFRHVARAEAALLILELGGYKVDDDDRAIKLVNDQWISIE